MKAKSLLTALFCSIVTFGAVAQNAEKSFGFINQNDVLIYDEPNTNSMPLPAQDKYNVVVIDYSGEQTDGWLQVLSYNGGVDLDLGYVEAKYVTPIKNAPIPMDRLNGKFLHKLNQNEHSMSAALRIDNTTNDNFSVDYYYWLSNEGSNNPIVLSQYGTMQGESMTDGTSRITSVSSSDVNRDNMSYILYDPDLDVLMADFTLWSIK